MSQKLSHTGQDGFKTRPFIQKGDLKLHLDTTD